MTRDYDVAVIGAGVIGAACAQALAPESDVVVLDRGGVAGDTTGQASGMITTPSVFPELPELGEYALSFFESFDGSGIFSFTRRGKLRFVLPGDETRARRLADREGISFVEVGDADDRYPGVFGDLSAYVGIVEWEREGWIDPVDYTMSLKHAAEAEGAVFRTGTEVTGVAVEAGAVTGVETEHGAVEAEHVVAAAGWRTRHLLADLIELPTRPFRWNAVVLETEADVSGWPMGSEAGLRIYWRPTDEGDLLVGGNEHTVDDPESEPPVVGESFRETVWGEVAGLLRIGDSRIVREDCCPTADTATPDTWPIVDAPPEAPDGLVVATGFHGRGVMSSPCAGAAVRAFVTGEEPPFPVEGFALDRFDSRSADFEFVSEFAGMHPDVVG